MKIGICLRTWSEAGGIGVYTRHIVPNLLRIDDKNEYYMFFDDRSLLGQFKNKVNAKEIYVPGKNKLYWDQVAVPKFSHKFGIDIIYHAKFAVPFMTGKKTVMVVHGTERFYYDNYHSKSDRLFFKLVYPRYFKKADAIISDSERSRQDIIKNLGVDEKKITTVHLAGDPACRIIQDKNQLERIREKYNLAKNFIIYVGHIYPGKNVGRLFRAFAKVRKNTDIDLVMAGKLRWKYKKDIELIDELNIQKNVKMLGYVPLDDLVGLYNIAALTAFPSYYECFPAIPIDANACGCPVVTSYTGGTPEAAGDAAVYINPLNVDSISDGILKILNDRQLKRKLTIKGFQNAKRFSWKKTAHKTLSILSALG